MATAEAATTTETYSDRIKASLDALAKCGVTEEQVRVKARLNPAEWERFTQSPERISTIEFVDLAEALFVDITYLLTGDRSQMVAFSPCGWEHIIRGAYSEIEG